ncbi:MAG: AAA family ATPase [Burkholderiales bacterium]|nr:AAA family ATPase [Burkholderiales bacterium]
MVAESGNGVHLLYPVDLLNDEANRDLIKGVLGTVAERFDDDDTKLDQSVFNAARITKLYGVVANKGDHIPLAPWRLSRIINAPERNAVVTIEQLRALVPVAPAKLPAAKRRGNYPAFDLLDFLTRLGIGYRQDMHEGRERFKLDHCPFNADHGCGEAAIFQKAGGELGFKCQHASCVDYRWQDVRELLDGPRESRAGRATANGNRPGEQNAATGTAGALRVTYRRVSDVQAQPIRWLWQGRIARGKVSMIAGNPGLGKSQLTASMAAIVSTGGLWPVDRTRCTQGNVIFLSAEDDAADTIRPRLEAVGADLNRVFVLDAVVESYTADGAEVRRAFNLKNDLAKLETLLIEVGDAALIVIDPVTAYLGDCDSHKNAEIRALIAPLSELAARHGVAVVCVSHLNKAGGSDALMRVQGSLAFVAASRAAFLVAKDPAGDGTRRLFVPMKNNIGNDQTGLAFAIESAEVPSAAGHIETSRIKWGAESVTVTADEAMTSQGDPEERSALKDAKQFLIELLKNGALSSKVIRADANGAAHSWRTIERARVALNIQVNRAGFGKGGIWTWRLPHTPPNTAIESIERHTNCAAAYEKSGGLCEEKPKRNEPDWEEF